MSTQWYVEGWYPDFCILSELLPAPHPNSWSSKMQILLVHISSELFSSSAVEKIYFCLWETEYEVTFLQQGRRAVSPPLISEDLLTPCHQRHLLQDRGSSSSFSVLSDSIAEPARAAPAETSFSPLSSFSLSLSTLMFCLLCWCFGLVQPGLALAVVWQVGAQSWQPREIHRISAFNQCLWWLQFGLPARIWCWVSLGYHEDFVISWSGRAVEGAACFQSSLAAFTLCWYVGRLGYLIFFPP